MPKVFLLFRDGGHGEGTPGKETDFIKSLGRRVQEEEFNEPVSALLGEEMKRCGVHVYDVSPGLRDVPLEERVATANRIYDEYCRKYGKENVVAVYMSIHFNALDGKFSAPSPSGFSVHIYPGHRDKAAGRLAKCLIEELQKGTKQINRGIVEQSLYVTKHTKMVAALSENGFMDNEREALLMLDPAFQREVAVEHAKGICKYFGIPYIAAPVPKPAAKPAKKEDVFYRVVTGSFGDRENAERQVQVLKKAGFESFIDAYQK